LPLPRAKGDCLLAVRTPAPRWPGFRRAKASLGERITAIEILERRCLEIARKYNERLRDPLSVSYPGTSWWELSDQTGEDNLVRRLEQVFEAGLEAGETLDGVIASSYEQATMLWRLREGIPEGQKREATRSNTTFRCRSRKSTPFSARPMKRCDRVSRVSAPTPSDTSAMATFITNPMQAGNEPAAAWAAKLPEVNRIVHDIVHRLGGSITAEHGIGRLRVGEIARYKPDFELEMMARVKQTFDPDNIMNPGKVIPACLLEPKDKRGAW